MKLVLSRKGMDSAAGGMASPILPDGTLLSLPIPDNDSGLKYSDVAYDGKSYMVGTLTRIIPIRVTVCIFPVIRCPLVIT